MFRIPKTVLSIGAGALALGALILAAPRTAHALAATLVQVTNTSANPVINLDVDSAGRNAYASVASCSQGANEFCYATFSPVPAGMRLVVERVSASASLSSGTYVAQLQLSGSGTLPAGGNGNTFFPITPLITLPNSISFAQYWNEQTKMYFEPGNQPSVYAYFGSGGADFITVNIFGYLVNLND